MKQYLLLLFLSFVLPACSHVPQERPSASLEAMTLNIYHEARGEPTIGWLAVGEVVMNRVKDPRWPNSVSGVVYQPWQFSWTNQKPYPKVKNHKLYKRIERVAEKVLSQSESMNLTKGANHYHADYVDPSWNKNMTHTLTIGHHIFYRD